MIRKSALIVIVVIAVLCGIAVFFLGNSFVEEIAELSLEKGLNTKVEIDSLNLNPVQMSVTFDSLNIQAEGGKNAVNTGSATFDVIGMQLLAKKLVINEMTLNDVAIDSEAKLPERQEASSDSDSAESIEISVEELTNDLPELDLDVLSQEFDIDEYTHPEKLESIKAIKKAQQEGNKKIAYWNDAIDNGHIEKEIKQIQSEANAIRKIKIKNISDLKTAIKALDQLRNKAINVEKEVKKTHSKANQDLKFITEGFGDIKALTEKDIKNAEKLANLKDINASHIGMMLFGKEAITKFEKAKGYLETARGFFSEKEESPKRKEGRIVRFPVVTTVFPQFLIQKLTVNGQLMEKEQPQTNWSGTVYNLTREQDLMGLPTSFDISGNEVGKSSKYLITGVFDNRDDKEIYDFTLKGTELELIQVELRKGDKTWPNYMSSKDVELTINLTLKKDKLNGSILLLAKSVQFSFSGKKNKKLNEIERAVRDVFEDMKCVEMRSTVEGLLSNPSFTVSSNLDDMLTKRLNDLVGAKIKQARNEIKNRIVTQTNGAKKEAESRLKAERQKVLAQMNRYRSDIERQKKRIIQLRKNAEKKQKQELNRLKKEAKAKLQAELNKRKKEAERKQREIEKKKKELEKELKDNLKKLIK